jgi:hypothetical protein
MELFIVLWQVLCALHSVLAADIPLVIQVAQAALPLFRHLAEYIKK